MALIGKGRQIIPEARPTAQREGVSLPLPEAPVIPSNPTLPAILPSPSSGSDPEKEELRATVRELRELLEAQSEMIQEERGSGRSGDRPADHVADVQPLDRDQDQPANPIPADAPAPTPPAPTPGAPAPNAKRRSLFLGAFLGKR